MTSDMVNLGAATAIDKLQAGHRAGVVIGRLDRCRKSSVPARTLHNLRNDPAVDAIDLVWHLRTITKAEARFLGWIGHWTLPIPSPEHMREADC